MTNRDGFDATVECKDFFTLWVGEKWTLLDDLDSEFRVEDKLGV